jgi:hypothetical protein
LDRPQAFGNRHVSSDASYSSYPQQHHITFISKFNVQMLYLPGLQNVVADFLSCLSPTPRPAGAVVAAPVAAAMVDFQAMATEQILCWETQHLLGGTSLIIALKKSR